VILQGVFNWKQSQCVLSPLRSPQRGDLRSRARLHSTNRNRHETALGADGSCSAEQVPSARAQAGIRHRRG